MQQLTIFDVLPFKFGDPVKVVEVTEDMDVETYFYLQDYQGLKGRVVKVIREPDLQYEVRYKNKERVGIFRHEELEGV